MSEQDNNAEVEAQDAAPAQESPATVEAQDAAPAQELAAGAEDTEADAAPADAAPADPPPAKGKGKGDRRGRRDDRRPRKEIPLPRKVEIGVEMATEGLRLLGVKVASLAGEIDGDQVVIRVGNIVEPAGASLEGRVWESLQFLLNKAINRDAARRTRLRLETESFRGRRGEKLGKVAQALARKVVTLRRPITIGPLAPGELRQFTSQLTRAGGVAVSATEDEAKKLVITPGSGGRRRRRRR